MILTTFTHSVRLSGEGPHALFLADRRAEPEALWSQGVLCNLREMDVKKVLLSAPWGWNQSTHPDLRGLFKIGEGPVAQLRPGVLVEVDAVIPVLETFRVTVLGGAAQTQVMVAITGVLRQFHTAGSSP